MRQTAKSREITLRPIRLTLPVPVQRAGRSKFLDFPGEWPFFSADKLRMCEIPGSGE